jgi:hypothetical protein
LSCVSLSFIFHTFLPLSRKIQCLKQITPAIGQTFGPILLLKWKFSLLMETKHTLRFSESVVGRITPEQPRCYRMRKPIYERLKPQVKDYSLTHWFCDETYTKLELINTFDGI